jgi:NTE family protein
MNDISSTTPPNTLRQRRHLHTGRPDRCDRVALVLQGGGALGAYQAGVYQAMHEANIMPDWVAGVSIGAINAAIIAGNPPHRRIAQLQAFWDLITERKIWAYTPDGDVFRKARNATSSLMTMVGGQPGFFTPRPTSPWLSFTGAQGATSYYDSSPLKETLNDSSISRSSTTRRSVSPSARSTCSPATSSISTIARRRSDRSTSWQAARCRRLCR